MPPSTSCSRRLPSTLGTGDPVEVEVTRVGVEEAAIVHAIVRAAFEARPPLDPPAEALLETEQEFRKRLEGHGGLVARVNGEPAGTLVFDPRERTMFLRRVGVIPAFQRHHVAVTLVEAAVASTQTCGGFDDVVVIAREELPNTVRFWERQGFREMSRNSPEVVLRRPLRAATFTAEEAEGTRQIGHALAALLRPGDLLVLAGSLGAGKTTFTQGIGAGLGVRGAVTSPTFVIARVHPNQAGGPALVHVDAYRLGGIAELDDLDLDTSLDEAVTVVEWGEGLAEGLSESRLEVRLDREEETDRRQIEIVAVGPRWDGVDLLSELGAVPAISEPVNSEGAVS